MRAYEASWALIAVFTVACDRPTSDLIVTRASQFSAAEVVRLEASASGSDGTHRGVVRAVNRLGAPVPSDPVDVRVAGEPVTVTFDPLGYASIMPKEPGVALLEAAGPTVELHTFASPWQAPDLHPAWGIELDAPDRAIAAHDGVLAAQEGQVWWAGAGAPAHRVLDVSAPILGMRARHVDLDGVLDAVVWTESEVYLLRGRLDGGVGFGGGWSAEGFTVGGADVGDLDGDRLPDLVVAWNGARSMVDLWRSDGRMTYEWSSTDILVERSIDVAVQDATARGQSQATVLHPGATEWSRFVATNGILVPSGPTLPPLEQTVGATPTLLSMGDTNADSAAEIAVSGDGALALVDVALQDDACRLGVEGAQCAPVVSFVTDPDFEHVASGDGNGDRLDDIWFVSGDEELRGSFFLAPLEQRFVGPVLEIPGAGPLAIRDTDDDGDVEVALARPGRVWRWGGRSRPNDTVQMWSARTLRRTITRARIARHFGLYELDGLPNTNEMAIITHENEDTRLKIVQYTHGKGRAAQLGALRLLDKRATPEDFVMCGTFAWFALAGRAWRVDVSDPDDLRITGLFGSRVSAVDCSVTDQGVYGAYLDGPNVVVYTPSGPLPKPLPAAGAGDVAVGADENGPLVRTCEAPCSIAFWPLGAEGQAVFAESDEAGTRIDGIPVGSHQGALSVQDLDGDGLLDLLGLDPVERLLFAHRSTGDSAAPVELWHTERDIVGRAQAADGTGDGVPNLWTVDAEGEASFALPAGVDETSR